MKMLFAAPAPSSASPASEPATSAKPLHEIKSPTPGTFYVAPGPDAETALQEALSASTPAFIDVISPDQIAETPPVIGWQLAENSRALPSGRA